MARKVYLKNSKGEKLYPATSSENVGMSDGSGSLDRKLSEMDKGKQDRLTFDESPVEGSGNPVTSGGIRQALDAQKKEVDAAKDAALANISEKEQDAISNFSSQRVTPEMLSESTKQLINASGGGTINNLADDEDLVSVNKGESLSVLKFADRAYNPANFSGKGYRILRKNIADVIDFDAITGVINVYDDVNPSAENIMEGQYDGEVEFVVINTTKNEMYGAVRVQTGNWTSKWTYYKDWTGTVNYDRSQYCSPEGKPIDGGIYCIAHIKPYKIFRDGKFSTYDISAGAPAKKGNVLSPKDLSEANMVYEIRYDFTGNFDTLAVGKDSILRFNGGSISNTNLKFDNALIENPSNYCIFYDVNFDSYGYLANEFVYDCWHNDMLGYDVIRSVKGLVLTRDYIIEDLQHFKKGAANSDNGKYRRSLTIDGNYHSIDVLSHKFTTKTDFLAVEKIILKNLSITDKAEDKIEHIGTIFNSAMAEFYNVRFDGFSRLVSNWSFNWDGQEDTYLHIENCTMYTTAFLAENRFDRVDILNSYISGKPDIRFDYMNDILSIGAQKPAGSGCNVMVVNSTIVGGWELVSGTVHKEGDISVDDGNYEDVRIENSVLYLFRFGRQSSDVKGMNTSIDIRNCKWIKGYADQGSYNGIKGLKLSYCNLYTIDKSLYGGSPFTLRDIQDFEMDNCNIYFHEKLKIGSFISFKLHNAFENMRMKFANITFISENKITLMSSEDSDNTEEVLSWAKEHLEFSGKNTLSFNMEKENLYNWTHSIFIGLTSRTGSVSNGNFIFLPIEGQYIACIKENSTSRLLNGITSGYVRHKDITQIPIKATILANGYFTGYNNRVADCMYDINANAVFYNGLDTAKSIEI